MREPWSTKKKLVVALVAFVAFQLLFRKAGGAFGWLAVMVMNVITFGVILLAVAFALAFSYRFLQGVLGKGKANVVEQPAQQEEVVDIEYGPIGENGSNPTPPTFEQTSPW